MKGDFSRHTYRPEKHYRRVLKQQGRVDLDADSNEQTDILEHLNRTESTDVIGPSGAPIEGGGFGVTSPVRTPSVDFDIGTGRMYVDGFLCEQDTEDLTYKSQPQRDYPAPPPIAPPTASRADLVYLDVWEHHVTAVEDPDLKEPALLGPDTTTRVRIVAQVKVVEDVPVDLCGEPVSGFPPAKSGGRLTTDVVATPDAGDPCLIPPSGGYRGLENRLYRVEIHDAGEAYRWPRPPGPTLAATVTDVQEVRTEGSIAGRPWSVGQMVEVLSDETNSDNESGVLARIDSVTPDSGASTVVLGLSVDVSDLEHDTNVRIRRVASYKVSRDNGSVVFPVEEFDSDEPEKLKVKRIGRDRILALRANDWVEITDNDSDLMEQPGIMARVEEPPDEARRILTLSKPITGFSVSKRAKVRRWDQTSDAKPVTDVFEHLEDGIQVLFSGTAFRTGDYWAFAARTATEGVEELDEAPPRGIEHHYARLALIHWTLASGAWTVTVDDCRPEFPPLTELTSLFYVGGDSQHGRPKEVLAQPLRVGVANGKWPVEGARVRFTILESVAPDGTATTGVGGAIGESTPAINGPRTDVIIETDADGVATCHWRLDDRAVGNQRPVVQVVEAVLLDPADEESHLPIRFHAHLLLPTIVYVSGDRQMGRANDVLKLPLIVGVADEAGPVPNVTVRFTTVADPPPAAPVTAPVTGDGLGASSVAIGTSPFQDTTDANGLAECYWRLGRPPATQAPPLIQRVRAHVLDSLGDPLDLQVLFSAHVFIEGVFYVAGDGQHGRPRAELKLPLAVGISDGWGPVANAIVRFRMVLLSSPSGDTGGFLRAPDNTTGRTINVQTDSEGIAQCYWTLDGKSFADDPVTQGVPLDQIVEAVLLDPITLNPLPDRHLRVEFSAHVLLPTLHYVGGDGQQGYPPNRLPRALEVGVRFGEERAGDNRPPASQIPELQVKVTIVALTGASNGGWLSEDEDASSGQRELPVDTVDGIAKCYWRLDVAPASQQVLVELVDDADHPSREGHPDLPLRFNAFVATASNIAYDPTGCEPIGDVNTVQEAIDALCHLTPGEEPAIHIIGVTAKDQGGQLVPIENDTIYPLLLLEKELWLMVDSTVLPESVTHKPVFFVTLELPYRLSGTTVGFQPVVLAGDTDLISGPSGDPNDPHKYSIRWRPVDYVVRLLIDLKLQTPILGRLRAKGNFIYEKAEPDDPGKYVDGDSFGVLGSPQNTRPRTVFPLQNPPPWKIGDGRKGGDFEMWIWLEAPTWNVNLTILDWGVISIGTTIPTKFLTILNYGDKPLLVHNAYLLEYGAPFAWTPGISRDNPLTIEPNESARMAVSFTPVGAGAYAASLILVTDDQEDPVRCITLRGIHPDPNNPIGPSLPPIVVPPEQYVRRR